MTEWGCWGYSSKWDKVHYYRTGGARPAIVLCHGATDNGLCWSPVAGALAEDYDVIMPDSRWHGFSDARQRVMIRTASGRPG